MRTKLLALSAVAMMSLATALPAAAAPESLTCSGSINVFGRMIPITTRVTVDSSVLAGLTVGNVVTLPNGLAVTITDITTVNGTLTVSGTAMLPNGITATVKCSGPAVV